MDKNINFAETAVLSLLLNNAKLFEKITELKPFMFSSEPHQYIH